MEGLGIILFLGVVAGLLIHRRRQAGILRRLAEHGVSIQAVAVRCTRRSPPKGIRHPVVEYEFETASGERVTGRSSATAEECRQLTRGSPVPVIYDARSPSLNRTRAYLVRKGYMYA